MIRYMMNVCVDVPYIQIHIKMVKLTENNYLLLNVEHLDDKRKTRYPIIKHLHMHFGNVKLYLLYYTIVHIYHLY